ncbi:hypothetical protein [Magnetospirillum sp. 64-120]|uniref:hypothetical protein n=1 Tax=Magnetospirillum sp. 64-120 TaxID=1895778 RepID=UPI0009268646|nr:hypothetical protein [Magnetospirillum sp. 64-120]OJX79516.1 MAG: hypothetical protein BGO92_13690 [Magnetospirillum sp. 64-120]
MVQTLRNALLISVPLALLTLPAAAESASDNAQPDLFRALGDFVMGGLGPARTMEEIQREEGEARAKALAAKRKAEAEASDEGTAPVEALAPQAVAAPAPQAVAASAAAPAKPAPAPSAPVKMAKVEPAKPVPAEAKPAEYATPVAVHVPVDIIPPPPKARPQFEAKALPVAPALPAEPLKSRIAATASVDQALKLGGPTQIYKRRLAVD